MSNDEVYHWVLASEIAGVLEAESRTGEGSDDWAHERLRRESRERRGMAP